MNETWAAPWVAEKLRTADGIEAIDVISSGLLRVTRKKHSPFNVGAIGVEAVVEPANVMSLFEKADGPQFVVNVPTTAIWTAAAIDLVHEHDSAFGGVGDLIRASREVNVPSYRYREYRFVERGLTQHNAVASLTRLYDRKFLVHRLRHSDLTLVMVDAYEVSADDVRTARDLYGAFDTVLKMTSYGGTTTAAREAAASMGAEIFKWGQLLSRLNRP